MTSVKQSEIWVGDYCLHKLLEKKNIALGEEQAIKCAAKLRPFSFLKLVFVSVIQRFRAHLHQ